MARLKFLEKGNGVRNPKIKFCALVLKSAISSLIFCTFWLLVFKSAAKFAYLVVYLLVIREFHSIAAIPTPT
jgi:hypothetical protein